MELILSDAEARTLRDYLRDHFQALQMEVARTENKGLRHILLSRQELIERLLTELEQEGRT